MPQRRTARAEADDHSSYLYTDDDWVDFGTKSFIAIYDKNTHEESKLIEPPCMGLQRTSEDEAGHLYFTTFDYSPLLALYGERPGSRVVRLNSNNSLDESFSTDL